MITGTRLQHLLASRVILKCDNTCTVVPVFMYVFDIIIPLLAYFLTTAIMVSWVPWYSLLLLYFIIIGILA